MKSIASYIYRRMAWYCRRRTCRKLERPPKRKKRSPVIRLGGGGRGEGGGAKQLIMGQRSKKARGVVRPEFRVRVTNFTPAKLLRRLRDSYVAAMHAFAGEKEGLPSSRSKRSDGGGGRQSSTVPPPKVLRKGGSGGGGQQSSTVPPPKVLRKAGSGGGELERKMMIRIYKNVTEAPRTPELVSCA